MRVLLTGGAGYIGSHTAVELIQRGDDVLILDNFANSRPQVLERIETITGTIPDLVEVDLTNRTATSAALENESFDAVIHFAGLKAVGESVKLPLKYYQTNLDSTLVLLELIAARSVKKLVFSSSATVYGVPQSARITELHPVGAGITNPYGASKMMIERIITDFARTQLDFSATLLRYFNPVGAHPSGLIGEDPSGMPNNLMPFISQVAVGLRDELSVFGDSYPTRDGTGERDYIHVVDLARGHLAALDADEPGVRPINLGTGIGTTVLEAVSTFEQATGTDVPYRIIAPRDGDVASVIADPALAQQLLGWRAERTLAEACRDSWVWQSANPRGYAA